jgi:hypothetical protein
VSNYLCQLVPVLQLVVVPVRYQYSSTCCYCCWILCNTHVLKANHKAIWSLADFRIFFLFKFIIWKFLLPKMLPACRKSGSSRHSVPVVTGSELILFMPVGTITGVHCLYGSRKQAVLRRPQPETSINKLFMRSSGLSFILVIKVHGKYDYGPGPRIVAKKPTFSEKNIRIFFPIL